MFQSQSFETPNEAGRLAIDYKQNLHMHFVGGGGSSITPASRRCSAFIQDTTIYNFTSDTANPNRRTKKCRPGPSRPTHHCHRDTGLVAKVQTHTPQGTPRQSRQSRVLQPLPEGGQPGTRPVLGNSSPAVGSYLRIWGGVYTDRPKRYMGRRSGAGVKVKFRQWKRFAVVLAVITARLRDLHHTLLCAKCACLPTARECITRIFRSVIRRSAIYLSLAPLLGPARPYRAIPPPHTAPARQRPT